jgi:Protein of unknown function (DUF3800)
MPIPLLGTRAPPDPAQLSDIYIDESSQTRHRFLVLGGIVVPTALVGAVNAEIVKCRFPELPFGEMKWTKVSRSKLEAYQRVVNAFFYADALKFCDFHSLVVDTHQLDHKRFNEGSREIGFNKEIYQLASKFARLYPDRLFHCYPDERPTNQLPGDLRDILNHGRRKSGDVRDWPFRRCHFRCSKQTLLLQLTDLLTGAIAYHINGHIDDPDASPAKRDLARFVLDRAGVRNPNCDTSVRGKFTIWHRQLRSR